MITKNNALKTKFNNKMKNLKILNQTVKLTITYSFLLITFIFINIPGDAAAALVKNSCSETSGKNKTVSLSASYHYCKEMNCKDSSYYESSDSDSNSDSVIQFSDFDSVLKSLEAIINFTTGKEEKNVTQESKNGVKIDPNKRNKKDSKNSKKKDSDKSIKQNSNKSSKKDPDKNYKKKQTIKKQKPKKA